jgi:hypothetical protein
MKDEASYVCDSCGEEIIVPIDLSAGTSQVYVEDCPVCCRPNVVHSKLTTTATCGCGRMGSRMLPRYRDPYFGVLASLTGSVAAAGVGVFAVATFNTDYLFAKEAEFPTAVAALRMAGHSVEGVLP